MEMCVGWDRVGCVLKQGGSLFQELGRPTLPLPALNPQVPGARRHASSPLAPAEPRPRWFKEGE